MLCRLSISNYAIISDISIEFDKGVNILTGETGAGKSILLGALGLILGDRADTKVLFSDSEKCIVEAEFDVRDYELQGLFEEHELDFEERTIFRREINQTGKSRAFINDTPVNLSVLSKFGEKLVNLHTQHETLELTNSGFQMEVVDAIAENGVLKTSYREQFYRLSDTGKALNELIQKEQESRAEMDYINFQYTELSEAQLKDGELTLLETEQTTLGNVEEIKLSISRALEIIQESDVSILTQLIELAGQIKTARNFNVALSQLSQRISGVQEEMKDVRSEFESLQDSITADPERLQEVSDRLDTIYRLLKKHNVSTVEELLTLQDTFERRLQNMESNSLRIQELEKQILAEQKETQALANKLHETRQKVVSVIEQKVIQLLSQVGMPSAQFVIELAKREKNELNESGCSHVRFLFSANKGFAPQEIASVASGGELSRVMLCIKSVLADVVSLPTMIFDEIDAGISGEVALKVGEIMKRLAVNHQLICITHLPQIARTGSRHFCIYKSEESRKTETKIKLLNDDERVLEIAKMLSGDKPSEASLANARELISS